MKRSAAHEGCRLLPHVALLLSLLALAGCTAVLTPLSGIPAHRLPPQFLAQPKKQPDPYRFHPAATGSSRAIPDRHRGRLGHLH